MKYHIATEWHIFLVQKGALVGIFNGFLWTNREVCRLKTLGEIGGYRDICPLGRQRGENMDGS